MTNDAIQIYNSLSREKELFRPLNPPKVTMYTCGVTVYDECHIGHARSLYIFDVIRRYLQYKGYKVDFVRNITDIDDKIINRARELKVDWKDLVEKYIIRYYEDLEVLGIAKADHEPRATENIPDMIAYIKGLIDKGYAYATKSGVYFNVRKFSEYGKLSGQSIDEMLTGVRKEPDETKEDPLDFALWKSSKEGEPFWESPWGNGRPGWHIECSVMSQKYLKTDTLDIHAGGRDLIFPHHENELSQAQALTGKPFAKFWIHHGLLTINNQKMAKSLGNFVTIKNFMEKYKNADLLKLLFLSTHYSHPVDYNDEKIVEAKQALERIMILMEKIEKKVTCLPAGRQVTSEGNDEIKGKFTKAMDDDFNTPQALASIFELVGIANKNIDNVDVITGARNSLKELLAVLGISIGKKSANAETETQAIEAKILERNKARAEKNFALADKIRKELEAGGVVLEDSKDGTLWRKKL